MEDPNGSKKPIKEQLGILFRPTNFLKTVSSQVPFASAATEMLNQLEGEHVESRITALEETGVQLTNKIRKLEASTAETPPPAFVEWPAAVNEYCLRHVEFAVVHTPPEEPGNEYVLPCANGCLVGDDYVLTCSEALTLVKDVAAHKRGRDIVVFNMCWYDFEAEAVDATTGLVLCKLTKRNETSFRQARELFRKEGVDFLVEPPTKVVAKWSIRPLLGQDCGFIVPSDSDNNMRQMEMTPVEFGCSVISHFRMPQRSALKVFVTAPYAGRIPQAGSAVFSRDGTLLGILSGVESYQYDTGRRAIVKTLLGFPKFTEPKLKPRTAR